MQRTLQRLFESDSLEVQIASDGVAGLEIFRKQPPSVVVLDLKLPRLSGKELCRTFKTQMPSVPIVVLSANDEVEDKVLLLELGADDYVTKPFSTDDLLARIRGLVRRTVPSPRLLAENLTPRELEVLRLMADQKSNAQIAGRLFVSENTVKTHVSNILAKLGCGDRAGAVLTAWKRHLIP